jgi:uncharacterized membrane protein YeaQ/YmgE (transglycosylase-associated protein family)
MIIGGYMLYENGLSMGTKYVMYIVGALVLRLLPEEVLMFLTNGVLQALVVSLIHVLFYTSAIMELTEKVGKHKILLAARAATGHVDAELDAKMEEDLRDLVETALGLRGLWKNTLLLGVFGFFVDFWRVFTSTWTFTGAFFLILAVKFLFDVIWPGMGGHEARMESLFRDLIPEHLRHGNEPQGYYYGAGKGKKKTKKNKKKR